MSSVGGPGFINYKVGYKMPEHWWAEAGPGQLLRLLPPSPQLGVRPPATVRIGVGWLGEGQDWPLPELGRGGRGAGRGGGAGDASARGLPPGQSLWAASDWPCPAHLSPGTPQGGDLPYLGPAADRDGRVALASLWLGSLSGAQTWERGACWGGAVPPKCLLLIMPSKNSLSLSSAQLEASSGKFNSKKRRKQRDGACTPVSGKHPEPGRGGRAAEGGARGEEVGLPVEQLLARGLSLALPAFPKKRAAAWSPPDSALYQWDWFRGQAGGLWENWPGLAFQPITRAAPMLDTLPPPWLDRSCWDKTLAGLGERCHQTEADPSQDMQG